MLGKISTNIVRSSGTEWEYQPDQSCWTNDKGDVSIHRPLPDESLQYILNSRLPKASNLIELAKSSGLMPETWVQRYFEDVSLLISEIKRLAG